MPDSTTSSPIVLALDDSPVIHQLIKRTLEPEYLVITVDNAVEALSIIYHQPISVLLLDVQMPDVTGLEFCRTVRSLPQFQHLPVIMVTSQDSPFDQVKGRLAGATEYLTKPFNAEQLRETVRQFISTSSVCL
jgi:twitching motility two-component system response regulator PilG